MQNQNQINAQWERFFKGLNPYEQAESINAVSARIMKTCKKIQECAGYPQSQTMLDKIARLENRLAEYKSLLKHMVSLMG